MWVLSHQNRIIEQFEQVLKIFVLGKRIRNKISFFYLKIVIFIAMNCFRNLTVDLTERLERQWMESIAKLAGKSHNCSILYR